MLVTVHSIIITPLTTTGTLTVYVDRVDSRESTKIHLQHGFHDRIAST